MDLDDFRRRLDRIITEFGGDRRAYAGGLREALVEAKVGVGTMRDSLAATEKELHAERGHLEDAERRGQLAAKIDDEETVAVAEKFVTRHRERVGLLERKLDVQREELRMAEAQLNELTEMYRSAQHGVPPGESTGGGLASGAGAQGGEEHRELDRKAKAAAVEAQLAALKRKLGKQ